MKKKALVLAIAGALSAPSAWAATDTSGMQFTSASEGFYASVRARYTSGDKDYSGSTIESASSRLGVRGSNDLGGGLTGFYQYEAGFSLDQRDRTTTTGSDNGSTPADDLDTRLGLVGLRGDFGEVVFGSFWTNDYSWTHGSTDQANTQSGYLNYSADRLGRSHRAAQYTTPDLNGFQGAINVALVNTGSGTKDDDNDVDSWNIAGVYNVQGFTVGGSYNQRADARATLARGAGTTSNTNDDGDNTSVANIDAADVGIDDASSWTIRLSYAQDNWSVNGWYGEDNTSDIGYFNDAANTALGDKRAKAEDQENFSIHGGVAIDKVNLYAIYETSDNTGGVSGRELSYGTVGVQYSLGAQTRTWIEYATVDQDGGAGDDYVNIGLRHDF